MKNSSLLFIFITLFYSTLIYANGFSMRDLRLQERRAALSDFKKIHLHRLNYKHKLYKKAKHKRLKKISRQSLAIMNENMHTGDELSNEMSNEIHESMEIIKGNDANMKVTANEDMDFVIKSGGDIVVYKEYGDKKEYENQKSMSMLEKTQSTTIQEEKKTVFPAEQVLETTLTETTNGGLSETITSPPPTTATDITQESSTDSGVSSAETIDTTEVIGTMQSTLDTSSDTLNSNIRVRYISPWVRKR